MITEILLLVLCVVFIYGYIVKKYLRPPKFPPGPPWIPLIGNAPELRKQAQALRGQHHVFTKMSQQYNSEVIGLKLGNERVICVCSYATVLQVLKSDDFLGRPDNFFFRLRTMGSRKGITGTDGELWKEQRAFLVAHLRALGFGKNSMERMIKQEIQDAMALIDGNLEAVDLASVISPSVLNVLWILTSGRSLKGNMRTTKLLELIRTRSKAFDMSGGILNNYPWLRHIAPEKTGYNLIQNINMIVRDFIMEVIDDHKKNWTENREDDFIYSFLTKMAENEGENSYFTEEQLLMVCLDIFIAGSYTTTNTIDFAFLAMILYPEVQQRVHKCLDSEFKPDEDIYYCDKHRVPYIEAVLLESQRYFSALPISGPRRVLRQTHLDEYIIPKNTTVLINLHSVHHDKAFWGDPEIFRPERFLDENGNLVSQERVLTFGLGKRKCLGDTLAKACIFLFFVEVLRKYRIEHQKGRDKPTGVLMPGIILTPEKYKARFIPKL